MSDGQPSATAETAWCEIEKAAGPPDVEPVDPVAVDAHRRDAYESYERFLRERLEALDRQRPALWPRDYSSVEAYVRSIEPMRDRLKAMLGFWVEPADRPPVKPIDVEPLLETDEFTATRFCIELLPGLSTYGVEMVPKRPGPHPGLVAQHGYSGSPELICGFTPTANAENGSYRSLGIRAVRRGYHVVAVYHPSGYGTLDDTVTRPLERFPEQHANYGKNRLHRMAIMAGGALFGLDMMGSSRAIDLLVSRPGVDPQRIGVYGLSQGGQSAMFLAALDTRVRASVCACYFNNRLTKLIGPCRSRSYLDWHEEDKFFPDVIRLFGDADLVSLIAPRAFAVEAGEHDHVIDLDQAAAEFERARVHYDRLGRSDCIAFFPHRGGHIAGARAAFDFLDRHLADPASATGELRA